MNDADDPELPVETILDMLLRPNTISQRQVDGIDQATWSIIVKRLRKHRALPYLHFVLIEKARLNLPDKQMQKLTKSAQQWASRQLMLGHEALAIHEALSTKNIPHMFLKGTPLAFASYDKARLRPAQDIDLLLHMKDIYAARDCIIEHGGGDIDVYQDMPQELVLGAKHLPPIWSPNRIVPVELHVRIFKQSADHASRAMDEFTASLWDNADSFAVSGTKLPCPRAIDTALHLISHSVYEDFFANGPLFLIDLRCLIGSGEVSPDELYERASRLGMGRGCALALKLLDYDVGEESVTEEIIAATSRLILQNPTRDAKSLNLIRSLQFRRFRGISVLLRKALPTKSHMIFLRREAGIVSGKDWSYARLWFAMLRDRIADLKLLVSRASGRGDVRRVIRVKGWLGAE